MPGLLPVAPAAARDQRRPGGGSAPPSRPPPSLTGLLAGPALRRVLLVNTILSGAWDTHLFVVPIYAVYIGLSATTIGVILAAFAAATFVIRLLLPYIQQRVQP